MTHQFIDVFYLPRVDPDVPYRCFLWHAEHIIDTVRQPTLESTVGWCKDHALPVRVYDPQVRSRLAAQGILTQTPNRPEPVRERAVGE